MPRKTIAKANGRRVVLWAPRKKDLDKETFCGCPKKIPEKNVHQYRARFQFFLETGQFPKQATKYKPIQDGLYELKTWKFRLLGYYEDDWKTFVIVMCLNKKKDDLEPSDVKAALKRVKLAKKDKDK